MGGAVFQKLGEQCKKELGMTVSAGAAAGDYCEEDPAKFDKTMMFKCWDARLQDLPAQAVPIRPWAARRTGI